LRALGYVESQNLILERRSAEGRYERFSDIVAELVRLKADVIVTGSTQLAQTAKEVTTTVPIVMAVSVDPVSEGLVQSHHCIISSARTITDCGIVSPSVLAVFKLITSSNLVGCSTGRSVGPME
jgi:hypothetical protein